MSVIKELKEAQDSLALAVADKAKIEKIAEEHKLEIKGMSEKLEQALKEIADMKASAEASAKAIAEAEEAHKAEAAKLAKEVEDGKAKLALQPEEAHVEGVKPVADGGQAVEPVNHVVEMNKLSGAAKIAYYREHAVEIDSQFKRK